MNQTTLQTAGYRYIRRNGVFAWAHPALAPDLLATGGVDCTDMTDEQFEKAVAVDQTAHLALPPLPSHRYCLNSCPVMEGYTADQMRTYALRAIAVAKVAV